MSTTHPYSPPTLHLPDYVPPTLSPATLIASISLPLAITLTLTASLFPQRVSFASLWFLLCGLLHTIFEGYFLRHRHELAGSNALLSQLWKHYALSDSRYLSGDAFVVAAETVTVFIIGPLCLAGFVVSLRTRPAGRGEHVLRLVVSTAHLWSCALYYLTEVVEGFVHCRPEALYRWGYMVGLNAPWVVVPVVLGWGSVRALVKEEGAKRKMG